MLLATVEGSVGGDDNDVEALTLCGGNPMPSPTRSRALVYIAPMILGLVAAQRASPGVRVADFLLIFASGVVVGVSLMALIQVLRSGQSGSG